MVLMKQLKCIKIKSSKYTLNLIFITVYQTGSVAYWLAWSPRVR